MHADKPFRRAEIAQRAARARANYSADHFDLSPPEDDDLIFQPDPNRDPRENPQSGDVLAVGDDVREVYHVLHGSVEYGFPRKAATRWLPLIRWQIWARNAEVRKVAL